MLIHRTFVSRLAEDCENGHIFISIPSISSCWPCEITWNAQVLLKIEYSSPGMKYFKIFMIEHLKNSLRLEILSRNELHVPRGEEELVRMKICASFPASIFETFQKCTNSNFWLAKDCPRQSEENFGIFFQILNTTILLVYWKGPYQSEHLICKYL